jgi:cytochrome P450
VNEALRLYPPTRRIHRQLKNEMVKIDIEWLHRDPITWGRDTMEFMPERSEDVRLKGLNGKIAFLPFGLGDLSCPAKNFTPMMIGILVGALMGGVREEWELVDGKVGGDVLGSEVLDGEREAYVRAEKG